MHFFEGDITINREWIEYNIRKCDTIIPLGRRHRHACDLRARALARSSYFEANLPIVRAAARYKKHLVFPSTSEVYGMCPDEEIDPESSNLGHGPINKPRCILRLFQAAHGRVIDAHGAVG